MLRTIATLAVAALVLAACEAAATRDFDRRPNAPAFNGAKVTGGSVRGNG